MINLDKTCILMLSSAVKQGWVGLPEHEGELAIALAYHQEVAEHQGVLLQHGVGHALGHGTHYLARAGSGGLHLQVGLGLNLMEPVTQQSNMKAAEDCCPVQR